MSEFVEYGFQEHRLFIDTPIDTVKKAARAENNRLRTILEGNSPLFHTVTEYGTVQLAFGAEHMDDRESFYRGNAAASDLIYAFNAIDRYMSDDQRDPSFEITMSDGSVDDRSNMGRHGMSARVKWPIKEASLVSKQASDDMRDMATTLGYLRGSQLASIGALVDESGISFVAHDFGSSSLDTDGSRLDDYIERGFAELTAHNLYNPMQVAVCFAGLISIIENSRVEEEDLFSYEDDVE